MLKTIFHFSKKTLYRLYVLAVFSGVLFLTLATYLVVYIDTDGDLNEQKTILIEKGISIEHIAEKLSNENVISHPMLFAAILRVVNTYQPIKAGEYDFLPQNSPKQVIQVLISGKSVIHKFVIPEGTTSFEIIQRIKNEPLLEGELITEYQDGELLPDTYYFTYGDKRQYFLDKINQAMVTTIDELWAKRPDTLPFKDKNEVLTLASIIEKETGIGEERPRISAVYHNRLKIKMKLQADPTVIYAITLGRSVLNRSLTYKDLKINSPYNTYYYTGLPPSPIANPGIDSIKAALNPLKTKEIFFVASGTGGHEFSSNIKDHNNNVASYRKINKQRKENEEAKN